MTTAEMAARYSSLTYADLPEPVISRVRDSVLDILGCMVAGRVLPSTTIVADLTPDLGGSGRSSTVFGNRVSAPWAGLVNATSAHGVELDDTDNSASLHPGNVVIPAALAVAQAVGADGARVAAAIVAGYDAMIRIGRAAGPQSQYERGFHPTATCGVFGAAVAAGSLLALDAARMTRALGIAGSSAAGSLEYIDSGAWTKRLQVGGAVQAGVLAALLAARDYQGPLTILEGRFGFLHAYAGSAAVAELTRGLDEPFAIMGVSVKAFACCRYCQTPVDGLLQLLGREGIQPGQVTSIDVGLVSAGHPIVAEPGEQKLNPRNSVDGQFSLPYSMAVALARGSAGLKDFDAASIADPEVRRLMPLVTVHREDALDAMYPRSWPARVRVGLAGGARAEILLTDCAGDPSRPLTWEQLRAKFLELTRDELGEAAAHQLLDTVSGFTRLGDMDELMDMVGARGAVPAGAGGLA
jgi:2-methylcitrate dehydratase PrpD